MKFSRLCVFLLGVVWVLPASADQRGVVAQLQTGNRPFVYGSPQGYTGLEVNLLKQIITKDKFNLKLNFDASQNTIEKPEIIGLREKDTLPNAYTASEEVAQSQYVLVSTKAPATVDFKHAGAARIGAIAQSEASQALASQSSIMTSYPNGDAAFEALLVGKVDYIALPEIMARAYALTANTPLTLSGEQLNLTAHFVFGVREDMGDLKQALDKELFSYQQSKEYETLWQQEGPPTKIPINTYVWLGGLAGIAILIWLIFAFHPGLSGVGWLQVRGLILLRVSPNWYGESANPEQETAFQQQIQAFQSKYHHLGLNLQLGMDSLRLEIKSPQRMLVTKPQVLERLTNELENLLSALPSKKYILQVNIQGTLSGARSIRQFVIANHQEKVGLNVTELPRFSLKRVIFNG